MNKKKLGSFKDGIQTFGRSLLLPIALLAPIGMVMGICSALAQSYMIQKFPILDTAVLKMNQDEIQVEPVESIKYLFTTRTCPNCKAAKEILREEDVNVEIIDAEEHPELARKYGIRQAPTLVVMDQEGDLRRYVNASNIQRYVDELGE